MIINGKQIELDIKDNETVRKVEVEIQGFEAAYATPPEAKLLSETYDFTTDLLYTFLDNVFGVGTSHDLFDGKKHFGMAMDAYYEIVEMYQDSLLVFEQERYDKALARKNKRIERNKLMAESARLEEENRLAMEEETEKAKEKLADRREELQKEQVLKQKKAHTNIPFSDMSNLPKVPLASVPVEDDAATRLASKLMENVPSDVG